MTRLPSRIAAWSMLAWAGACTSFDHTLAEFDLVCGLDENELRPGAIAYEDNVTGWRIAAESAGATIPSDALENPSGFARERIIDLVDFARDDPRIAGRVAPRLLYVAIADPSALNRLEAVEGMADLLRDLDADVLSRVMFDVAEARARSDLLDTLATLVPAGRQQPQLEAGPRARYVEILSAVASGPFVSPIDDIRAVYLLSAAERAETDAELAGATLDALRNTMANGLSRTLVGMLRSPDVRQREAAARNLYQIAGAGALPMILSALSLSDGGAYRYPLGASERRALLRLCSQTGGEVLFTRFADGPRPIEFVYDTAARDEEPGLRLLALETMARCLGRSVSFDPRWADEWWREFALSEGS